MLQRATGRRYADFVSERLWQPLGAKDATLWLDRPGGTPRAFSYFVARPGDWLRLGVMIAQRGRFDDREILPAAYRLYQLSGTAHRVSKLVPVHRRLRADNVFAVHDTTLPSLPPGLFA